MDRFARDHSHPAGSPKGSLGALEAAWRFGGPGQLTVRLAMVAKLIDRYLARRLASECHLNIAQWRLLSMLRYTDKATLRELAMQAWVDRGDVSRALAALEKRGLVARTADPRDRRSPHFSITQQGEALQKAFHETWTEFHETFNAAIPPDRVDMIDEALESFARTCLDMLHER